MSGIVLSAAVRQNLLSLQSTATQMAQTQNNLSTGNKVNSALDNPTNFFTAQGLNNRSSDISNLLDGISNGVQVIQAANTGLTSVQNLVSQAKSIANQALQTSIGYSTKSSVTATAVSGATASNILGTTSYAAGSFTGAAISDSKTSTTATTATKLSGGSTSVDALTTALTTSDTLSINGKTISFNSGSGTTSSASGASIDITTGTLNDVINAINTITGTTTASIASGALSIATGTTSSGVTVGGSSNALSSLGLSSGGSSSNVGSASVTSLSTSGTALVGTASTALGGLTLSVAATGVGGAATTVTFGTGNGQISTLDQLNSALAANNVQATISSTGAITLSTTNDAASSTLGAIGGTAAGSGKLFNGLTAAAPVADATSQATRSNLVNQYNALLTQIDQTAADSSFNGVNLLNGDQLQLTFNETGKSKLNITGVNDTSAGLGLSNLATTAFKDNQATNRF